MLETTQCLSAITPARIISTLLIHIPPANSAERSSCLTQICNELLPQVAERKLASAVDIFVEEEAAGTRLRQSNHFMGQSGTISQSNYIPTHPIPSAAWKLEYGSAPYVDHLEASGLEQIAKIAASSTIANNPSWGLSSPGNPFSTRPWAI